MFLFSQWFSLIQAASFRTQQCGLSASRHTDRVTTELLVRRSRRVSEHLVPSHPEGGPAAQAKVTNLVCGRSLNRPTVNEMLEVLQSCTRRLPVWMWFMQILMAASSQALKKRHVTLLVHLVLLNVQYVDEYSNEVSLLLFHF